MKQDISFKIYQYFISHPHDIVEIELKNKTIIKGRLIGVFKGDKTYITKWHVTESENILGMDAFGILEGAIIDHYNIEKISFFTNNIITVFAN